ncbi:MAG TPA: hypothetical protein VFN56_03470 [Candidatus Saccharimonadales bacterium]|nr:hypothetical protein [Candidatus Saccharimonadales bacterium]
MSAEQIPSVEMAAVMAYAEAPYRELAHLALSQGMENVHRVALADGDSAAMEAGSAYISTLAGVLNSYRPAGVEAESVSIDTLEGSELLAEHTVNRDDFMLYSDVALPDVKAHTRHVQAGNAWNALCRVYMYGQLRAQGQRTLMRTPKLPDIDLEFAIPPTALHSYDGVDLRLLSVVKFLKNFDEFSKLHNSLSASDILGRDTGTSKVNFIRAFVDYKIAEIKSSLAKL